jgi:hypothetical protein
VGRVSSNSLGGGLRTAGTTIVAPAQEAARRARIRAAARANLAAVLCEEYGVDPTEAAPSPSALRQAAASFAELATILGLTAGASGGAAARGGSGTTEPDAETRPALRSRSASASAASPAPPPPALPAGRDRLRWSYPAPAGRCPACDRIYQLTRRGRLRTHKEWKADATGARYRSTQDCPASGLEPAD